MCIYIHIIPFTIYIYIYTYTPFIEWFSKSILKKFELKTRQDQLKKLKRIIPQDYLQKHVLARYTEHQDRFHLYFQKELLKKNSNFIG